MKERACRFCGCVEARACAGGCSWVGPDICSKCAFSDGPATCAAKGTALAIAINGRFFAGFKSGRITTAWSLAGAELFLLGRGDLLQKAWIRIQRVRRRDPIGILAVVTPTSIEAIP